MKPPFDYTVESDFELLNYCRSVSCVSVIAFDLCTNILLKHHDNRKLSVKNIKLNCLNLRMDVHEFRTRGIILYSITEGSVLIFIYTNQMVYFLSFSFFLRNTQ